MPIVVNDIVPVLCARSRSLPQIPIQMRRNADLPADTYGRTVVHIPRLGIMNMSYITCLKFVNGSYDIRPGATLIAHLNHLAILDRSTHKHLVFSRVMTCRFLKIDMLACLQSHNGSLGMPMVRHGDDCRIEFIGGEHTAYVSLSLGKPARKFLYLGAASFESLGITITDIGNFALRHLRKTLRQSATSRIDTYHTYPDTVIGPYDGTLFRYRERRNSIGKRKAGSSQRSALDKFSS